MYRMLLALLLSFPLIGTLTVVAQEPDLSPEQRQAALAKLMPGMSIVTFQFLGEGKTLGMTFLHDGDDPAFQALVGSTDDQYYAFDKFMFESKTELRPQCNAILHAALAATTPEEIAAAEASMIQTIGTAYDAMNAELRTILTPQQISKLLALELQSANYMMPSSIPLIDYSAYQALDLNDKQKEELATIRKDFEQEQKQFFLDMQAMLPKPGKKPTAEEMKEIGAKMAEHEKKGEALSNRIRAKIGSILNKEQTDKLNDLLANIPDFLKEKRKKMGLPPKPVDEPAYEKWKDSWKPGQPIPQQFREREKARRRPFP